jgi:hypothetical protein
MGAKPRLKLSACFEDSLRFKPSVEAPAIRLAYLKNDHLPSVRSSVGNLDLLGSLGRLDPLVFARYLITFSIGLAVALAWQSYGDATREAAVLKAISLDREAMRQSIDRIAASVATTQEQMTRRIERIVERSTDRLAAGQEQATREISDLQTFEQYVLGRNSTPPSRPAPTTVSRPVLRWPQAPLAFAPARNP